MKLHVGQGTTVGAITIFPVWSDQRVAPSRRYTTSLEDVAISELEDGPTVPQLIATNAGAQPVLVLDGQLFDGGWQHRMATRSSLLPAGSRTALDVACVEQHRWGGTNVQRSRGGRATTYVRDGFERAGGQSEVWRRVERYGATTTGSLVDRLQLDGGQAALVRRVTRPLAGQVGIVVGVGGQPIALEVFDDPRTLVEQYPAIVRAACLEGVGRTALPTPSRRARRMVERLERTHLDVEPDVGQTGRLGRATSEALSVMSLRHGLRTVHLRATNRRHPILQEA